MKTSRVSDLPIPPGELLAEELEARGMTHEKFASLMGWPKPAVRDLINGKKRITAEGALDLERVLGASAELWMRLDMTYQLARLRAVKTSRRA